MKKAIIITIMLMTLTTLMTSNVSAQFKDVKENSVFATSIDRVSALGIMNGVGNDMFKPYSLFNREQFAKVIVTCAGLDSYADSLKGYSTFPDVDPNSWSCGFINEALNKGYIKGMIDGTFHPQDNVNFAQVCTVTVKALGYTDQDVAGLWPRNYIEKAAAIGITEGIQLEPEDSVSRGNIAMMIDKLVDSKIKKTNPTDADKTFANYTGAFTQYIILGNSKTTDTINDTQVLTDKGIYYVKDSIDSLEIGNSYRLILEGDKIVKAYPKLTSVLNITVEKMFDSSIVYIKNGESVNITLPEKTIYYYKGIKQTYENLKNILYKNSSIILSSNREKTGYEYGVIVDPVFSKPVVVYDTKIISANKIGDIDYSEKIPIIKNGQLIDISKIMTADVIFNVTDLWGGNRYIVDIDEKVEGIIVDIIPSKITPKSIKIDTTTYDISKNMELNKINYMPGAFNVNNNVKLLLDYDGKVVDIFDDTSNYAFVLNTSKATSTESADFGATIYSVKMLFSEGKVETYNILTEPSMYMGKLVYYTFRNEKVVDLSLLPPNTIESEYLLNKDNRRFGDSYITDNVKIFNIISTASGVDQKVELLNFGDLPDGIISAGKIVMLSKIGHFQDINVIVLSDLFDQKYKFAYVKENTDAKFSGGKTIYTFSLMINGVQYTYKTNITEFIYGDVIKVLFDNNTIKGYVEKDNNIVTAAKIQAIDSRKIKMGDKLYQLTSNVPIYLRNKNGDVSVMEMKDVDINRYFSKIALFFDKPFEQGGKVIIISLLE